MTHLTQWQHSLPHSWKVLSLKYAAKYSVSNVDKLSDENEIPVELCNYTDVYKNDYITSDFEFMKATATEDEINKFGLEVGDVLITKDSESWDDIGIPALVVETKTNLLCGYHLAIIKPNKFSLNPRYLFRCLQAKEIRAQLELASTGVTRYGLPKDAIGSLLLPLPDLITQERLVDYLDRETSRIDSMIVAKENLLKLLEEKKQALITKAVTKGLDPNAKNKDSGINWLGKVPEHWEVKKLKYLSDLKSGNFITADSISPIGTYPVYGGNGLRGYTSEKTHTGDYVLIGRQGALCGNINYANGDFWASEHAIVCRPIIEYPVFWLGELLRVMNLNQYSLAAAQPGLSVEVIENLQIPVPPKEEREMIADFMMKENQKLSSIMQLTESSVRLLKERRGALISTTVTGNNSKFYEN